MFVLALVLTVNAKQSFYAKLAKTGGPAIGPGVGTVVPIGTSDEDMKYQLTVAGETKSFWHDVPLRPPGEAELFHFVCEIPRGTTAKMEINKEAENNPIIQDRKKGKLRFYKYKPEVGSLVNYGAIPQTWESPHIKDPATGEGGDNDPIDVVQVNKKACKLGDIQRVRVLGAFALIDDGETDWKVIVQNVDDPDEPVTKGATLYDVVSKERMSEIIEWFKMYKTAEGKGENTFGLNGDIVDKDHAERVVIETHRQWTELLADARTDEL